VQRQREVAGLYVPRTQRPAHRHRPASGLDSAPQHRFPGRRHLPPILFGAIVIAVMLVAWAALTPSSISNESSVVPAPVNPSLVRSIAYTVPDGNVDDIYVRAINATGAGELLASFPTHFDLHARGAASPSGDRLAVLSTTGIDSTYAHMTLIDLPDGQRTTFERDVDATVDYLSTLAWSRDGQDVVISHTAPPDSTGRSSVRLLDVHAASAVVSPVATFNDVYGAAPVGFSVDGQSLYVVVTDQSGSNLWIVRDGKSQKVAPLSPGRTRDWSLSPDGSRLAYIEILGAGERTYAGRTLVIATGAVIDSDPSTNQLGPAWEPSSQVPDFGGPGGTVQLAQASPPASYIVPTSWSPDGTTLVATIYSASSDLGPSYPATIALVTSGHRVPIATAEGAQILGWVRDVN